MEQGVALPKYLLIVYFFLFLRGKYNTRTYRQIRTDITVLTQITLITGKLHCIAKNIC